MGKRKKSFWYCRQYCVDHKVPSSLIDKGYADIIEYTKVNPTQLILMKELKMLSLMDLLINL